MATVKILRGTVINGEAVDVGAIVSDIPDALARFLARTGKGVIVKTETATEEDSTDLTTETADAIVAAETATTRPQRKGKAK
jgi:hypothetical protein